MSKQKNLSSNQPVLSPLQQAAIDKDKLPVRSQSSRETPNSQAETTSSVDTNSI